VIIPPLSVIERLCAEAMTRAERRLYRKLTSDLDDFQRTALDNILGTRLNTKQSMLAWLRQAPGAANPRNILEHIERLKALRSIALPEELGRNIHQNHLLRLARQGAQTPVNDFRDLTDERRYATLVTVLLETSATITDEILDLNDRLLGSLFAKAKRQFESAFQGCLRFKCGSIRELKAADRLSVHELSAVNGHCLRFTYSATATATFYISSFTEKEPINPF